MDTSSKAQKVDHHVDSDRLSDRLSDLPLEIIHSILALIPIREAVRTSILSTQWRYTWTTLPHLDFDYDWEDEDEQTEDHEKFITRVLFRHEGPIHKFVLCSPKRDLTYLDEWIFCLSRNGIRQLTLHMQCDNFPLLKMRSSIYSCKKLTDLRLSGCELDPPPLTFKGFFFLRSLSLYMVSMSADGIYNLIAVCPHLEKLELIGMDNFELKISAPNLKYMDLLGSHVILCIDAPLMTVISVELNNYNGDSTDKDLEISACDYAKCFGGFTNLQKLFGYHDFTKYLSLGIELSHHALVFHHLKLIYLETVDFEDVKEVLVVAHLVIGAPNLQKLNIWARFKSRKDDESDSEAPLLSFRDLGCPSNFRLEKLTDVSLKYIEGLGMEVQFLKFLLESSPVLETMTVKLRDTTKEKRNNLRAKLEGCNWASPNVKLCKKRRPKTSGSHFL